ncbi:MAG: electron transport complex subunit E [Clostridiales bacterium]|nr:electron transport complex subunit E [Clostridiales bacterium]
MAEKRSLGKEFSKGLLIENPVLRLVLGTCPTLATSTSMVNALGMGISVLIVLVCSNTVISLLRKVIPSKVRIPAYIVVIASFVTMVQMLVKAFVPTLNEALGVFLPLIVVNCIILGRAEAFAGKNSVIASAVDGVGMGIGFTMALLCMSTIRELFGNGTLLDGASTSILALFGVTKFNGVDVFAHLPIEPALIFILAPGGFFTFGLLMAFANKIAESKGKSKAELRGCASCPMAASCSLLLSGEKEDVLSKNPRAAVPAINSEEVAK